MAYNSRIEANSEIFEKIQTINVGSSYTLKPIFPQLIDNEAAFYLINSKNEEVKKYLPNAYAKDKEQAKERLYELIKGMALKQCLTYCIKPKEQPFPIGYIILNTPLAPTGLNSWTVDFWLADKFQGGGIMKLSLAYILQYLQNNAVPGMRALVDSDNTKSIKLLEKLGFKFTAQEPTGKRRFVYSIRLN